MAGGRAGGAAPYGAWLSALPSLQIAPGLRPLWLPMQVGVGGKGARGAVLWGVAARWVHRLW